jgi:YegS/Rv2252/BmrU family lipid kinase
MLDPSVTTVIVNPTAAGGRVGKRWPTLSGQLTSALGEGVEFVLSECAGGASALSRAAVQAGRTTILSLGGDGTHNEVVNGIMAAQPPPGAITFGVLPAGTGGDFARILDAPREPIGAAHALAHAPRSPLDVGKVFIQTPEPGRVHHFVNVATFGIGGLIDTLVNESSKLLGGRASFFIGTVRALLRYKPATVRLIVDDKPFGTFEINTVGLGNGQFCGGGMHITPSANPGDGWFEGIIIEQRPVWKTLGLTAAIYRGTHGEYDFVHTFRARTLVAEVEGDHPAFLDLDGEAPGVIPARFEILPGALQLLGKLRG